MARFIASQRKPAEPKPAPPRSPSNAPTGWNTLEELRQIVTSNGCSKAQFDHALDAVGSDPHRVGTYLHRFAITQATHGKINGK